MSELVIVRHGQASFFEADYDKLSSLGEEQSRALGLYWANQEIRFDRTYTGTLKRQKRTAEVIGETLGDHGLPWPESAILAGLDEYPAGEVMDALIPELCEREERFRRLNSDYETATESSDRYRTFHRLLEAVMTVWVSGEYDAEGIESWATYSGGVRDALQAITSVEDSGLRVAVVSSGGPIGIAVQTALDAPDVKAVEINWRVHNCSLTSFAFTPKRFTLDAFNRVPHLTDPTLLTYR